MNIHVFLIRKNIEKHEADKIFLQIPKANILPTAYYVMHIAFVAPKQSERQARVHSGAEPHTEAVRLCAA